MSLTKISTRILLMLSYVVGVSRKKNQTVLNASNSIGLASLWTLTMGYLNRLKIGWYKPSYAIFLKCEHRNWSSDIIVHINFINSEKSFKMSFQRTIQNGIYFQYALYTLKLVVAHNALQLIHLIDLSIKVNKWLI